MLNSVLAIFNESVSADPTTQCNLSIFDTQPHEDNNHSRRLIQYMRFIENGFESFWHILSLLQTFLQKSRLQLTSTNVNALLILSVSFVDKWINDEPNGIYFWSKVLKCSYTSLFHMEITFFSSISYDIRYNNQTVLEMQSHFCNIIMKRQTFRVIPESDLLCTETISPTNEYEYVT